jgi:hypothetical protein
MALDQNKILQEISQGKIQNDSENAYIIIASKMQNNYLRALVQEFRINKTLSETEILDGILLLDEKIEKKEVLSKDLREIIL